MGAVRAPDGRRGALRDEDTIPLTDRTLFVAPAGIHLPVFPAGTTVVVEYEILEGRNVLTHAPAVRP